jgi:hypothetical protein
MTSAAKIAANRRNAQRSTGPRSAAGKARTRYNALEHRLNVPARYDQATTDEIETLADCLSTDSFDPQEQDLALRAAEAQFDLLRVQRAKVDLVNGAAKHLERVDASLPEGERAALAFMGKTETLAAFDRYERRATASRNRLLRKLRALQDFNDRQESIELVGPRRPKQQLTTLPFVENVWKLDIHRVVKTATEIGVKLQPQNRSWAFRIDWGWPQEKPTVRICMRVELSGDRGLLMIFDMNRQQIAQSWSLARVLTPVGGGKWLAQCPESGKMVQDLYLDPAQQRFRSRHALKLRYRSKAMLPWERHWKRCQKLMHRIGATHSDILLDSLPPRPKYMGRTAYWRLCHEIRTEASSMYRAQLRALLGERRFAQMRAQAITHALRHLDEGE